MRRFNSIELLEDHLEHVHYSDQNVSGSKLNLNQQPVGQTPCKCLITSCNGLNIIDISSLVRHLNTVHESEPRECIFENCRTRFQAGSASRHHFRLQHVKLNKIELKSKYKVQASIVTGSGETSEDFSFDVSNSDCSNTESNYPASDISINSSDSDSDDVANDDDKFYVKAFADFGNRMCHEKFIPHSTMQYISTEFLAHSQKALEDREVAVKKVLRGIPELTEVNIEEIMRVVSEDKFVNAQKELDTEHKRDAFLRSNFNYVNPVEYVLNKENVLKGQPKEVYHYIPIVQTFKNLIQDQTFIGMMNNATAMSNYESQVLRDCKDGLAFKNNTFFKKNPDAYACIMYSDAVELVNPLGSGKGKHKIVQIFWTLADIPRSQRSQIDRIQLALVVKEKVMRKYGEQLIYENLIKDLHKLEEGIDISDQGAPSKIVKCGLLLYAADNLEAMQVGGFSTCFSSYDICRHCHCQYEDLVDNIHDYDGDTAHNHWTEEEYDAIVTAIEREGVQTGEKDVEQVLDLFCEPNSSDDSEDDCDSDESFHSDETFGGDDRFGLRKCCPLNELNAFHAVYGFPPDLLHDLFEGVVAQDLLGVIKILSHEGWFTLLDYNSSIKRQDFKSYERNDKPELIKTFKAHKLSGKAVSIWTHLRNFGFIIKPFVLDIDHMALSLGLSLASIVERLAAAEIREYEVDILEDAIIEYLDHRKIVFGSYPDLLGKVKPKHHYLVHYPDAIRNFGPCLAYWTGRFESKHRVSKGLAESAKNFKNISLTVSVRQQKRMASKFYNGLFETQNIKLPLTVLNRADVEKDQTSVGSYIKVNMREGDFICNEIELRGHHYKVNDVVVLNAVDRSTLDVGWIQTVLVKESGAVYFVVKQYRALRADLGFFTTSTPLDNELALKSFDELADYKPIVIHGTVNRFNFALHHYVSVSHK